MESHASGNRVQRPPVKKRNRKIWSCLECRRKKLQCDHGLPACGRCTRAGHASSCTYIDTTNLVSKNDGSARLPHVITDAAKTNGQGPSPPASLGVLEERIKRLETATGTADRRDAIALSGRPFLSGSDPIDDDVADNEANCTSLQGASFRTRFTGNTITSALAELVPGLASLTSHAFATFDTVDQIRHFLNTIEARSHLQVPKPMPSTALELRQFLPIKREADRLVRLYFDSFDLIYPVIYTTQFEQDKLELWDDGHRDDARPIILILLVIGISHCLDSTPYVSTATGGHCPRDKATAIFDTVHCWLHVQVQRQSRLIDYQIDFLLLLGQQLNGKRSKRTWINSGSLIRTFLTRGLHRDPAHLSKETSSLDQTMRRRLWAAAADFELQSAFEGGMPASPWLGQADTLSPANIHDSDLEKVVDPRPSDEFTKSSFLAISAKSLILRHELNTELNDLRQSMSFERACDFTKELKRFLNDIPTWTEPGSGVVHALLNINLHQYILAIHQQQLRCAPSVVDKQFSRLMLVESAIQIIDSHTRALENGTRAAELLYNDHARAALSICYAYMTADPLSDRLLMVAIEKEGMRAIESAIELVGEKIFCFGMSSEHLWLMNAAKAVMQTRADPHRKDQYTREAVERFAVPFDKLKGAKSETAARDSMDDPAVTDPPLAPASDALMVSYDELAEWAFDDWTFDPLDVSYSSFLNS